MGNIHIYSEENLDKELKKVIEKEFNNKELIRDINFELAEKNMNSNITSALFQDGTITVDKLSPEEKMAITKVSYNVLKLEKLNFEKYYEVEQRGDYKSFKNLKPQTKEIELHKLQKIDDYNYVGRISYEQIYEYMSNVLFRYNKSSQRASKIKSYGTKNSSIRTIDIKQKNVNAMLQLILDGKLESTQVIINVRLPEEDEDFEPKYVFEPIDEKNLPDIGTLSVEPLYDIDNKDFTVAEVLDGFHRLVAVQQAVAQYKSENNGAILEGGLDIRVVMRTLSEAQEIVRQIFERSDTNKEFIKGFRQGDDVDFLKLIEDNSKILKGQISINFEEHTVNKTLTYKTILLDTIKLTEIQVEKKGSVRDIAKKLGATIDELVESLKFKYYNDNFDEMKNNSLLLSCNMFVGYLAIANTMRELKDYNRIDEVIDSLYSISKEQLEKLKINRSPNVCNYKVIYRYFTNLIMEVLKVA